VWGRKKSPRRRAQPSERLRPALQLKQSPGLPLTFGGRGGEAGRLRGVHDGAEGVTGGVSRGGGVTGGTGGSAGGIVRAVACSGMSGEGGLASNADPYLAPREGARRLDGQAGPVVLRSMPLEQRQHVLGAVGRPDGQRHLVSVVQEFSEEVVGG